jgi:hypothetical protein
MDLLPRVLASPVAGEHACYVNVYYIGLERFAWS